MDSNSNTSDQPRPARKKATEMDQAELVTAIVGLSYPDWVYLICCIPGALRKLGFGGVLFPSFGLPLLIDWVTATGPRAPGLVALQRAYDQCFSNPPTLRVRRLFWGFFKKHPRWAWSSTLGILTVFVMIWFYWDCLFPGIGFHEFYDQVGLAPSSPDQSTASKVLGHVHENVCWEGIVTETVGIGGQVLSFKVKPVGVKEEPKPSQQITVFPTGLEPAFFAKLPVKVRFRGEILNINWINGVNIKSKSVVKLE